MKAKSTAEERLDKNNELCDSSRLTEDVTARAVMLCLWSSSASPKRRVMVGRLCPMRPLLSRRANGVMMQWRVSDAP